jgi:hypothetical protein
LHLLKLDPNLFGQLLLGHAHHPALMPDPLAHMGVNWVLHRTLLAKKGRAVTTL